MLVRNLGYAVVTSSPKASVAQPHSMTSSCYMSMQRQQENSADRGPAGDPGDSPSVPRLQGICSQGKGHIGVP